MASVVDRHASGVSSRSARMIVLSLSVIALLLIATRLFLWSAWQYPAPVGDSGLFASVSQYGCTDGVLHTPIFPIDPESRYTWHGITQPALLKAFDFGCTNAGNFRALSLLTAATFVLCLWITRLVKPAWMRLAFAVAVIGLLVKQGFRPDDLAILLALLTEYWVDRKRPFFVVPLVLLAWTHPMGFVIYGCYVLLQYGTVWLADWRRQLFPVLSWAVATNVVMFISYPFPLSAHFHSMLMQGVKVVGQGWGSLTYAFITNAFYPGFGLIVVVLFALAAWRNRLLWMLLLPIWYLWLRAPALYYNVMPLYAALLYWALRRGATALEARRPHGAPERLDDGARDSAQPLIIRGGFVLIALLAGVGIAQGVARDFVSKTRFDGSLQQTMNVYEKLHAEGYRYCRVPSFFTAFLPYEAFEKSFDPTLKECATVPTDHRLDLISASGTGAGMQQCNNMQGPHSMGLMGRLFRSDSGYSVYACPHSEP